MKQHDNENEPNTWSAIGLQAALIVNKLRVKAQLTEKQTPHDSENRTAEDGGAKQPEKNPGADRAYVGQRLRELRSWERKISGR